MGNINNSNNFFQKLTLTATIYILYRVFKNFENGDYTN